MTEGDRQPVCFCLTYEIRISSFSLIAGIIESVNTDSRIAVCDLLISFGKGRDPNLEVNKTNHAVLSYPLLPTFLAVVLVVGFVASCCFFAWMRTAILAPRIAVLRSGVLSFGERG